MPKTQIIVVLQFQSAFFGREGEKIEFLFLDRQFFRFRNFQPNFLFKHFTANRRKRRFSRLPFNQKLGAIVDSPKPLCDKIGQPSFAACHFRQTVELNSVQGFIDRHSVFLLYSGNTVIFAGLTSQPVILYFYRPSRPLSRQKLFPVKKAIFSKDSPGQTPIKQMDGDNVPH